VTVAAWIWKARRDCKRCQGFGLYADERQQVDGRRVAISPQAIANGERTVVCEVCGADGNPVEKKEPKRRRM
jgi:hypothetical protein